MCEYGVRILDADWRYALCRWLFYWLVMFPSYIGICAALPLEFVRVNGN